MLSQADLVNLILFKDSRGDVDEPQVPYNQELHRIYGLLQKYKYDQHELEIIRQEIMLSLPKWRIKQLSRDKEESNG